METRGDWPEAKAVVAAVKAWRHALALIDHLGDGSSVNHVVNAVEAELNHADLELAKAVRDHLNAHIEHLESGEHAECESK